MRNEWRGAFFTSDLAEHWGRWTPLAIQAVGSNSLAHVALGGILGCLFLRHRVKASYVAAFLCAWLVKDFSIDWRNTGYTPIAFIDGLWDLSCYLTGFVGINQVYAQGVKRGMA